MVRCTIDIDRSPPCHSPATVFSSDLYAITDPWEAPENHGVWAYGKILKTPSITGIIAVIDGAVQVVF